MARWEAHAQLRGIYTASTPPGSRARISAGNRLRRGLSSCAVARMRETGRSLLFPVRHGDDRLQQQSRGYVTPDSFTHGTSEQRMRWFNKGLENGRIVEEGNHEALIELGGLYAHLHELQFQES